MIKLSIAVALFLAAVGLPTAAQGASLNPLELTPSPEAAGMATGIDPQLQLSLDLGLRTAVSHAPAVSLPQAPKLTITPAAFKPTAEFVVGRDTRILTEYGQKNWEVRPNFAMRDQWNFLRRQTLGPDTFERFANLFDIDEQDRPWSDTTTVHLMAPTKDWLVPFATIAHEVDVNEDFDRFGVGAGAMLILGKNQNLGAEIIHFGGDRSQSNDAFSKETRYLVRFQLEF